jgi:hypothetical protein
LPGFGSPRPWAAWGCLLNLDYSEIHDALRAVVPPGAVFEVRLIGERKGQIDSGYFNNPAEAASAICAMQGWYKGMYFTPNPVLPDVMARSHNRITPWSQVTTQDPEIVRRRWLLIDVDPKRPTGIASSNAEHEAALNKLSIIRGTLGVLYGFPEPMVVDSGNGGHLLYPMDLKSCSMMQLASLIRLYSMPPAFGVYPAHGRVRGTIPLIGHTGVAVCSNGPMPLNVSLL